MAQGQLGSLESLSQSHSFSSPVTDPTLYPSSIPQTAPSDFSRDASEINLARVYSAEVYSQTTASMPPLKPQASFYSLDKGLEKLASDHHQPAFDDKVSLVTDSTPADSSGRTSPLRPQALDISVSNTASEQHQQEQEMLSTFAIPSPPVSTQQSIAAVAALSSTTTADSVSSIEPPRTLWMGDLDPWLDVNGVQDLWWRVLHRKVNVKLIKPKYSNSTLNFTSGGNTNDPNAQHSGYCFVEFETFEDAQRALALNGQLLPDIAIPSQQHFPNNPDNQKKYFRLNWASGATLNAPIIQSPEYSLFVGDLSASTTEAHLLAFFQKHFPKSIKTVRVMTDPTTGKSRCFGFVRFTNENERQQALNQMNGVWLGGRPIRVALASPRYSNGSSASNFGNTGSSGSVMPSESGIKGVNGLAIPDLSIPLSEPSSAQSLSFIGQSSHPEFQQKPSQLLVAAGLQPDHISGRNTNFGPIPPPPPPPSHEMPPFGGAPGPHQHHPPPPPPPLASDVMYMHPFPPQIMQTSTAAFPPIMAHGPHPHPPPLPPSQQLSGPNSRKSSDGSILRDTRSPGPQGGMLEYVGNLNNQSSAYTDPTNTTVFIGGLSSEANEDTLYGLFEQFGIIQQIKIPPGKNCGFVKYQTREEAETAISSMQGFIIGGNRIRLSWGRISAHNRRFQMHHQPSPHHLPPAPPPELLHFHGPNAHNQTLGFGIHTNSQPLKMYHSSSNVEQISPSTQTRPPQGSANPLLGYGAGSGGVAGANVHQHSAFDNSSPSSSSYVQSYQSTLAPALKSSSYDFGGLASSIRGAASSLGDSNASFGSSSKVYSHVNQNNRLASSVTVQAPVTLERSRGSTSSTGSQRSGDMMFSEYNPMTNRFIAKSYSDFSINTNEMPGGSPDGDKDVSGIIDSFDKVDIK